MDDLISRQAAIDAVYERMRQIGYENYPHVLSIRQAIRDLPPAQSERKKGHWIKISPANIYECSECGKNVMTGDISAYDFCHGCGADMRGEQDDS